MRCRTHFSQCLLVFLLSFPIYLAAQQSFTIRYIEIEGLQKCKPQVVIRELPFQEGEVLDQITLLEVMDEAADRLRNTGLFSSTEVVIAEFAEDNLVDLKVQVVETWYPYLLPVFELADRNFNVWFVEYNRDFRRTNYGLHFYHFNVSGRGDRYELLIQRGFTHKYETEYYAPFLSKKRKNTGLFVNAMYTNSRDLNYITQDNRQVFHRDLDAFLFSRRRLIVGLEHRNSIYKTQGISLGAYRYLIDEQVQTDLNPDFLLGSVAQQFMTLEYTLLLDTRDERPYPMEGYLFKGIARKEGLGVFGEANNLFVSGDWRYYKRFSDRFSMSSRTYVKLGVQRNQLNFFQKRILGYQDQYIRGYEYYVMDGLDALLLKHDLRLKVMDQTINWGRLVWIESYKKMPTEVYVVPFLDLGYVNDPWESGTNTFNRSWLPGYGIGLNFRFYYDKVFRLEWSRNVLGEAGFYLHWDLRV